MNLEQKRRATIGPEDYRRYRRARRADDIAMTVLSSCVCFFMAYVLWNM